MPVSVHAALLGGLAGMLEVPDGGVCLVNAPLYHGGPFLFAMLPAYRRSIARPLLRQSPWATPFGASTGS